jgi:hypothetical protein
MRLQKRNWVAWLLAFLGVVIICAEVVRNWFFDHRIEAWVIAIGSAFGFIGFFLIDPNRALIAFGFLRDSTVQIVGVVRSGRRSTDPIVPQVVVTPAKPPDPPQEVP